MRRSKKSSAREQAEMRRREELYRAGEPALDLHGQTAILVDDGLATGSTMMAAVRHVRSLKAAGVVIGIPVGSRQACDRLRKEADDLVCLATPELFFAVGEWYRDFRQVSDTEVQNLLAQSRHRIARLKSGMILFAAPEFGVHAAALRNPFPDWLWANFGSAGSITVSCLSSSIRRLRANPALF